MLGFHCCDISTEREMPASACTSSMSVCFVMCPRSASRGCNINALLLLLLLIILDHSICCVVQKGSSAVHYIAGHMSKINGIDWSPFSESQFATCAHDCSVKVCHSIDW